MINIEKYLKHIKIIKKFPSRKNKIISMRFNSCFTYYDNRIITKIKRLLKRNYKTYKISIILIILWITQTFSLLYYNLYQEQNRLIAALSWEKYNNNIRIAKIEKLTSDCFENYGIGGFDELIAGIKDNGMAIEKAIEDFPDSKKKEIEKKKIEKYGLHNFKSLSVNWLIFPIAIKDSYIAKKDCEYKYRVNFQNGRWEKHQGLDIANQKDKEIIASGNGKIISTGYSKIGGKYIIAEYYNNKEKVRVYLGHLDKIFIKKDQIVKQGQIIAKMGKTGSYIDGEHVHFTILILKKKKWKTQNPVLKSLWGNKYIKEF